jgi:hypothetical protein
VQTNIKELLSKGRTSYTFSNLRSIKGQGLSQKWNEPKATALPQEKLEKFNGTYYNMMLGEIEITAGNEGLKMKSQFTSPLVLLPINEQMFFIPESGIQIEFVNNLNSSERELRFFENGYWSFSAWAE